MNSKTETQSLIGDFAISDLDSDQLTSLFSELSETLETPDHWTVQDLESDIESPETVSESLSRLSDIRQDLDNLSESLQKIETPISLEKTIKDLEDLETLIGLVDRTSDLSSLSLTPIILEYLNVDPEEIADRLGYDPIDSLTKSLEILTAVSGILETLHGRLTKTKTEDDLYWSLEYLDSLTQGLAKVRKTLETLRSDLETRQKRLTVLSAIRSDLETKTVIADTLREKVSVSFLDSGGSPKYDPKTGQYIGSSDGYGRHFERNSLRDFESESRVFVHIDSWGLSPTINIYHFLSDSLEYDPVLDSLFLEYGQTPDNEKESWLSLGHTFVEDLKEIFSVSGLYGDGDPITDNTCNSENLLSQDFQYHYLTLEDWITGVLISVHNGADIRGGYTRPVFYEVSGQYDETRILDYARLYMSIEDPGGQTRSHNLYSDDGYHLYVDNGDRLESRSPYNWTDPDRKFAIEKTRLERDIERLESIATDLTLWTDPQDGANVDRLSKLLDIRQVKTDRLAVLEEKTRYRSFGSLKIDDLRTMTLEDYPDHDPEDLIDWLSDNRPVIWYRTDHKTGETVLTSPGLGRVYFDF